MVELHHMALNIKNVEVERLAAEVAHLANETKTEAIRVALQERRARLRCGRGPSERRKHLHRLLETVIWPQIPKDVLGKPISKEEREDILGIGPEGY